MASNLSSPRCPGPVSTPGAPGLSSPSAEERTTVIIRHMPLSFDRDAAMRLLKQEGFGDRYDFLYMPINVSAQGGFGYVFLNLVSVADAQDCIAHFHGFDGWDIQSDEVAQADWCALQGLESHVRRYRDSPVMHESVPEKCKPAVFSSGQQLPFPAPTKPLKAPKVRLAATKNRRHAWH